MLQKLGLFFLSLLAFVAVMFILATGKITVPARAAGTPVAQAAQPAQAAPQPTAKPAQPAPAPTQAPAAAPAQAAPAQQKASGAPTPAPIAPPPDQNLPGGHAVDGAPKTDGLMYYKVKSGDTLFRIAARYGVSVAALQRANNLRGTLIYAGQTLCIPASGAQPGKPGDSGHDVKYPDQNGTYGPWYAEYFNNNGFMGTPAYVKYDSAIHFDWGYGTPNEKVIQSDNFSVRWTSTRFLATGVYSFNLKYNDGIRVELNGVELINDLGNPNGEREIGFYIPVATNQVTIKVEYVERTDKAFVNVRFNRVSASMVAPVSPWKAEFYNSVDMTGPVIWTDSKPKIEYSWGQGSPKPGLVSIDYFSARITRSEYIPGGKYVWVARVKDGVRIFIDGQSILDKWQEQPLTTFVSPAFDVPAGYHTITVEFQHFQGNATLEVYRELR